MQIRRTSEYILAYALWIASSLLGLVVAWIVRNTYLLATEVLTMNAELRGTPSQQFQVRYTRDAVDRFGIIILAVLMVILVVIIEYTYRTGVETGQLPRRFLLLTAVELSTLFVAQVITIICSGILGVFTISGVLVALGVLALVVALTWLASRLPKPSGASAVIL